MTKHKCNKEVELQQIQDDINYIKKSLTGNGEIGLIKEVNKNTKFRHQALANLALIKWLLGLSASSLIISIINFINNWM